MTIEARIDCVNKTDRYNPHERISHVGGPNPDNARWRLTEAEAIAGIDDGRWAFYVDEPGTPRVEVVIAISPQGNRYLKTRADGVQPDNLLALAECPQR